MPALRQRAVDIEAEFAQSLGSTMRGTIIQRCEMTDCWNISVDGEFVARVTEFDLNDQGISLAVYVEQLVAGLCCPRCGIQTSGQMCQDCREVIAEELYDLAETLEDL